jgi:spore coat polysaccharide biosynthesis protein SpsF (cytidylyltransferase family)
VAQSIVVVQARMGSSRLPGKVLMDIEGAPLIEVVLRRIAAASRASAVVVATSTEAPDDPLASAVEALGFTAFRGPENDVLRRYAMAAAPHRPDLVVRVTGDNPLCDPSYLDASVDALLRAKADYVCFAGLPFGVAPEVFTFEALNRADREGLLPRHREHVTTYIKEHAEAFKILAPPCRPEHARPQFRFTVDEPDDLRFMRALFHRLGNPSRSGPGLRAAIELLDREPSLLEINRHVRQKPVV